MCGIAGILALRGSPGLGARGTKMADAIRHRGPDDTGVWEDSAAGVCLAHRRLSIIDLSPAGHQPMQSTGLRYVIVFNGEIYNHLEIRAELEIAGAAPCWRGHSDTETLLAAFTKWGIEQTLNRSVGMFALAVWDREERALYLARDRFGEKPLYYGWTAGAFLFGSELKALRAYPGFRNELSREALAMYFRFMYVPAPQSIYEGVYKLEPGCLLLVRNAAPDVAPSTPLRPPATYGSVHVHRWWSLASTITKAANAPITDPIEAIDALQEHLVRAVKLQCLADVPLGAFLSGGVDSSTIVALMQAQSSHPVRTFTVGFLESGFDESPHARAVAEHLGTDHTELTVTPPQALGVIPALPSMYDEPFADASQIPTHLVCAAARRHVTVALSGDAGDELFGGYNRYFWGPSIWQRLSWLPYAARQALSSAIRLVPVRNWDGIGHAMGTLGGTAVARMGDKAHKLAARLNRVRSMDDLYLSLVSEWQSGSDVVKGHSQTVQEQPSLLADPLPSSGTSDPQLRMMYWDGITYLPDDILCKVDRAAMAVSLETRIPYLDHRVAELAWRLPLHMKIRGAEGKWALRQVLYQYVPKELIERPKAGLGVPVGQWLRGPLKAWAEALLHESRLTREGYLHPEPILEAWRQHQTGRYDWTSKLWSVLMFQAWLEANH